MSNERTIDYTIEAATTSDGAGVKLKRSLGSRQTLRMDPYLMLDEFGTDNPDDYIAGFPAHPHRGFETITYMLDGHMRHEDHMGNVGELREGDVQWMTAGRGVIHSEMPMQKSGRMRGFQLWLNLPAAEKMQPAKYQDISATELPTGRLGPVFAKVIAGQLDVDADSLPGPINSPSTAPFIADLHWTKSGTVNLPLDPGLAAMLYVFEGVVSVGDEPVSSSHAAVLGQGTGLTLTAKAGARTLVIAGRPIGEPIVQHGPFVMNTRAEIETAIADYRSGELVAEAG